MKQARADALDIYWYETIYQGECDIQSVIEALIMQQHYLMHGSLPRWNTEF